MAVGPRSAPRRAGVDGLPADVVAFRRAILRWYDRERRDLPFRRTRDPYLILVSEVMAQQTQISRVAEAWPPFVARFPTVADLAAAPLDDVVRAWGGLGYNQRAVLLHRAARTIVAEHAGVVPGEPDALAALPGIGPYTARAVAAIAFGRAVAPVDTNVRRVLGRVAGLAADVAASIVQPLADAVVPADRAADWTAALMDLAARHCRPRPRCDGCPAASWCRSRDELAAGPPAGRLRACRPPASRPPFEASARWLRGRIVAALRDAPPGGWTSVRAPIGRHDSAAVGNALAALEVDGLVERHPADPSLARLASA